MYSFGLFCGDHHGDTHTDTHTHTRTRTRTRTGRGRAHRQILSPYASVDRDKRKYVSPLLLGVKLPYLLLLQPFFSSSSSDDELLRHAYRKPLLGVSGNQLAVCWSWEG